MNFAGRFPLSGIALAFARIALAVALATGLGGIGACAQSASTDGGAQAELSRAKEIFGQAETAIDQGRFVDAEKLIETAPRQGEFAKTYGAFLDGRLAEATGRLTKARDIYRAVLNEHPELARVRLRLAKVLGALGDIDAARHHFDFVLGSDISDSVADRVRIDARAIEASKRWTGDVYVSLAPSSNMTSGTSLNSVNIGGLSFAPSASGRRQAGVGVLYGGDFAYVEPAANDWNWLSTFSTAHYDYPGVAYDDRSLRATTGFQHLFDAATLTAELVGQRRWFGGLGYDSAFGPQLSARGFVGTHERLTATASVLAQHFDALGYMDGYHVSAAGLWDHFTLPGQFLRMGLLYDREGTRNHFLDYDQFGALIGYSIDLPAAITAFPQISYAPRQYQGDFPLTVSPRFDKLLVSSLAITKKDLTLFGAAPRLTLTYTDNWSNVKFYQFDRFDVILALTREF